MGVTYGITERDIAVAKAMKLWRCNAQRYQTLRSEYKRLVERARSLGMSAQEIPLIPLSVERQWPMIPFLFTKSEYEARCFLGDKPAWEINQIIRDIEGLSSNNSYNTYCSRTIDLGYKVRNYGRKATFGFDPGYPRTAAPYQNRSRRVPSTD